MRVCAAQLVRYLHLSMREEEDDCTASLNLTLSR